MNERKPLDPELGPYAGPTDTGDKPPGADSDKIKPVPNKSENNEDDQTRAGN